MKVTSIFEEDTERLRGQLKRLEDRSLQGKSTTDYISVPVETLEQLLEQTEPSSWTIEAEFSKGYEIHLETKDELEAITLMRELRREGLNVRVWVEQP